GPAETDARSLVPHNIVGAEVLDEHQHVERVGHGAEGTAVVCADEVTVPEPKLHLHIDRFHIRSPTYADACTRAPRPTVDEANHQTLGKAGHVKSSSPAR